MVRRLLALAFGIVVIAGALAIRRDREPDSTRAPTGEVDVYSVFDDVPVTLLCAEELAGLCDSLSLVVSDVIVESAWVTADRLAAGGKLGADAWMTFRPWPELARSVDPPLPSVLGAVSIVARSPLVLAGPTPVMAAVQERCPDPRTLLSCAAAGEAQLMMRDPKKSAVGALGLAAMGNEVRSALSAAVPSDDDVRAALGAVVAKARTTAVPYEDVTRLGTGALALTVEADVALAVAAVDVEILRGYDEIQALYPFDTHSAEVVIAPAVTFTQAGDLVAALRSRSGVYLIERTGYTVDAHTPGFLYAEKVFAARPTIRTDLEPPLLAFLTSMRSLPRDLAPPAAPEPAPASP